LAGEIRGNLKEEIKYNDEKGKVTKDGKDGNINLTEAEKQRKER
jgi:hypothetical protein